MTLNEIFGSLFNYINTQAKLFYQALDFSRYPLIILDILIVALLFYWLYLLIKGTRGMRILFGIIVLGLALVVSRILGLVALNWVLQNVVTMVVIAIPIVFQPELRRALEKLGRPEIIKTMKTGDWDEQKVVFEIAEAVKVLVQNKVGALIVIKRKTGLDEYIETGTKINASVSRKLILNLFFPNSPLHDGAVIIDKDKVVAASVTLPLAETERTFAYGTRHRAALGISSETDALGIVVSEERGTISLAHDGKMISKINPAKFEQTLMLLLSSQKGIFPKKFFNGKKGRA